MTLNDALENLEHVVLYLAKQGTSNSNPELFDKAVSALNSVEETLGLEMPGTVVISPAEPLYRETFNANINSNPKTYVTPRPYPHDNEPQELDS